MPDTVVSAQQLAVRLREVRDHIAVRERERPLGGLRSILMPCARIPSVREEVRSKINTHPFHAVAGSDLAELLNVIEPRDVRRVAELGVIGRASKVELPGSFCKRVQARGRAGGHHGSCRRGGRRGGGSLQGEMA